jgi:hypothetical protein
MMIYEYRLAMEIWLLDTCPRQEYSRRSMSIGVIVCSTYRNMDSCFLFLMEDLDDTSVCQCLCVDLDIRFGMFEEILYLGACINWREYYMIGYLSLIYPTISGVRDE